MKRRWLAGLLVLLTGCAKNIDEGAKIILPPLETGKEVYARFVTDKGEIVARLWPKTAPVTVENFIALAKGGKVWTDPAGGKKTSRPLYEGTRFFKVIPGFMIQGGDPLNTGEGGPGYRIDDEIHPGRTFKKPGQLAMASSEANGAGSQFFITVGQAPWLNKKHTIFGEIVSGLEVAEEISRLPRSEHDAPLRMPALKNILIEEKE